MGTRKIPEQRQPEASVRDLLLQWLPSLPGLVLAFTQHDAGRECDYQDLAPLRLTLQPLLSADLDQRLTVCLGAHALPRPLLKAVATRAQGSPALAALTLSSATTAGTSRRCGNWPRRSRRAV
ncbi:hypothetical protein [uncultured Thiodictyon sp.]|uniref:hypothetical protein n=1 Tax=uncultured Thiodictyon sp. TaxID=1846217 RepID=UPI0025F6C0B3|nr:hypothetical protein [uncultured Thiodictyon sp.]